MFLRACMLVAINVTWMKIYVLKVDGVFYCHLSLHVDWFISFN